MAFFVTMYRNYHPYLGHGYLTRPVGNRCLRCGRKMVIGLTKNCGWDFLLWKPRHSKKVLLGYIHGWNCLEYPKDPEGMSNGR